MWIPYLIIIKFKMLILGTSFMQYFEFFYIKSQGKAAKYTLKIKELK